MVDSISLIQEKECQEDAVHEPDYNPRAPVLEAGEDDLVDDLVERALGIWGVGSREEILAAAKKYSLDAVEVAMGMCERREPRPYSFGFLLGICENWKEQEVVVRPLPPKPDPADPRTFMQNYNPGPKTRDLFPASVERITPEALAETISQARKPGMDGKIGRTALRVGIRSGEIGQEDVPAELLVEPSHAAHEKPAAGSVAKQPPQPAGDQKPVLAPHYTVNKDSRSMAKPERTSGQSPPRVTIPPAPALEPELSPSERGSSLALRC